MRGTIDPEPVNRALRRGLALLAVPLLAGGCASAPPIPPPEAKARAAAASSYSGTLRVDLRGPEFRGRARVLLAFRRPGALRIELPGPTGSRLVVVARQDALWAVFPGERAVLRTRATAPELQALLGVALTPGEIADILVGVPPKGLLRYEARWGSVLPREVRATLPDGARLVAKVEDAEIDAALSPAAFDAPAHDGFRAIDASEARRLWSR